RKTSASLTPARRASSRVEVPWKPCSATTSSAAATIWDRRSRALSLGLGPGRGDFPAFVLVVTMAVSDERSRAEISKDSLIFNQENVQSHPESSWKVSSV